MTRPLPSPSGSAAGADVLLALADRCEREEPSRELDAAIAMAFGKYNRSFPNAPAHVTTSLDAAVTLVPEGFAWSANSDVAGNASVDKWGEISEQGRAKTPAMALCAAALRARASLPNPPHGGGA